MPGYATEPVKLSAEDHRTLRRQIQDSGLAIPAMLESLPLTGTPKAKAKNLERVKRRWNWAMARGRLLRSFHC